MSKPGDDAIDLIERAAAATSNEPPFVTSTAATTRAVDHRTDPSARIDDFRVAFAHGDVRPYAQPVVEIGSGRIIGYQGIAAMASPSTGNAQILGFIEMIADTPLANQVDLYVTRELAAVVALSVGATPLRLYAPVSRRLISDIRTEQYLSEIADAFFLLSITQMHLQIARPRSTSRRRRFTSARIPARCRRCPRRHTDIERASDAARVLSTHPYAELHIARDITRTVVTDPNARRTVAEIVRLRSRQCRAGRRSESRHGATRDVLVEAGCDFAFGNLYGQPEPANTMG